MLAAKETLRHGMHALGYTSNNAVIENLIQYSLLLQQWNKTFNLTAIDDLQAIVVRHLLDSLAIAPYLTGQQHILDVGTGAGLPGIPLAMLFPEKAYTLVDSQGKKLRFLRHIHQACHLTNVSLVQSRIEQFKPEKKFDVIVTRAFASIKDFLQSAEHCLQKNGIFLAMKGVYPQQELQEVPERFTIHAVHPVQVPGLHEQRHVVEIGIKGNLTWER